MAPTGRQNVATGQVIASNWGNDVWDQSVNCFANTADRATQWRTPHEGATSYLADTGSLYLYRAGAWRNITGADNAQGSFIGTYTGQPLSTVSRVAQYTTDVNGDAIVVQTQPGLGVLVATATAAAGNLFNCSVYVVDGNIVVKVFTGITPVGNTPVWVSVIAWTFPL